MVRELAALVEEMAVMLARSMGDATGVLQVGYHDRFTGVRLYDREGRAWQGELVDDGDQIDAVVNALAQDQTGVAMELRFGPAGTYEFRYTLGLRTLSPARVVGDQQFRYPHHPLAVRSVATTPEPGDTDPAVLAEVGGLVDEFVRRYEQLKGRPPQFAPGHSEAEIAAAEARIGLRLPEDLRALYRLVHDDDAEHGLLGCQSLLPLDEVVRHYLDSELGAWGWNDDLFGPVRVVHDAAPYGRIRRMSRNVRWITVATDRACNWCAIDLDPAPDGTSGQLFVYGRDYDESVGYVAESVTAILSEVVTALQAGEVEDEYPDEEYLGLPDQIGAAIEVDGSAVLNLANTSLAAAVADLAAPSHVQKLYLHDGDRSDLAELATLPQLRQLAIQTAQAVELTIPRTVPLESLSVRADAIDLTPLAGHPTLWDLEIANATHPVTITPLLDMPALVRLDLSTVTVPDLTLVAQLPNLRVLVLNQAQWHQLHETGAMPPHLAAAEMTGQQTLPDAVAWVSTLTPRAWASSLPTITGRVQVVQGS
ncbi:SMI1/KNR4 family protein [Actinocatenispora thailandica]|nr:SMI1/KNR4 family protein [Actinocatenispora thailandica]